MGEMESSLKIRPHHLLCILGFRSLGYNEEFVANMSKVVKELRSNPTFPITLVVGCDAICESCPYNKQGRCIKKKSSDLETRTMDLKLLQVLEFAPGAQMPIAEALGRIKERITLKELAEFCHDCEWWKLGYCAEGLANLKRTNTAP
jgi:hypothetical protein